MQKKMVQVSSFSILAGLITALVQTSMLYFLEESWITFAVVFLLDFLILVYLLGSSFSYSSCFWYLFVEELCTLLLGIPAWLGLYGTLFPYDNAMLWLFILHLAIAFLYCTIRYLADFGPRFLYYNSFFLKFSILLWLALIAAFAYCQLYQPPLSALIQESSPLPNSNLIPFYHLAGIIEVYIQKEISLCPYVRYLLSYGAFFIPVGFYLHLFTRRRLSVLRFFLFLLLPAAIEVAQYFLAPAYCEVDDIFPAFWGCILGSGLYNLLNGICYSLHDEDFLKRESRMSIYF